MHSFHLWICALLFVSIAPAQDKTSVSVRHTGTDAVGVLLAQAVQSELKKSGYPDAHLARGGFRDFIEIVSLDSSAANGGESSFVSVVISSIDPGAWPQPYQWYHKVMLVKRAEVPQFAVRLIRDMQASLCNVLKSSLSPCPPEEPWPGVPQKPENRPVATPRATPSD